MGESEKTSVGDALFLGTLVGVMKGTEVIHNTCDYIQCSQQVQAFINTLLTFAGESQNDILGRTADHVIEKMLPEEEIV